MDGMIMTRSLQSIPWQERSKRERIIITLATAAMFIIAVKLVVIFVYLVIMLDSQYKHMDYMSLFSHVTLSYNCKQIMSHEKLFKCLLGCVIFLTNKENFFEISTRQKCYQAAFTEMGALVSKDLWGDKIWLSNSTCRYMDSKEICVSFCCVLLGFGIMLSLILLVAYFVLRYNDVYQYCPECFPNSL